VNLLNVLPIVLHELIKVVPQHFISNVLNVYQPRLHC
jgi:hypothetical protein